MMVSFRFGALCHVFRVLSNLLEILQPFTFLTHPISCSKIWRSSSVPKNGQISILNMLPNLWFLKQVPCYISLGSLLTNFRVAWSNSFLNRRAQQEKSQRPLCSTCTDDGTIASGETKNCWASSGAQIWYIQKRNIDLLPKAIFFWNLFDNWTFEISNLNARYSANCHVGSVEDILDNFNDHMNHLNRGGSPSKNLNSDQPFSRGNIRSAKKLMASLFSAKWKICLRGRKQYRFLMNIEDVPGPRWFKTWPFHPLVGGHLTNHLKGHVFTHHPKKVTIAELPGPCFFGGCVLLDLPKRETQ